MKQAFIYSSKVWLTIIVVASIIGGAILYYRYTDQMFYPWTRVFEVPQVGIELRFVYYFPSWLVFVPVSTWLNGRLTDRYRKILLSIIAVVLSMTAFLAMDYHSLFKDDTGIFAGFPPSLMWTCTYAVVAFVTAWFYQLKSKPVNKEETGAIL